MMKRQRSSSSTSCLGRLPVPTSSVALASEIFQLARMTCENINYPALSFAPEVRAPFATRQRPAQSIAVSRRHLVLWRVTHRTLRDGAHALLAEVKPGVFLSNTKTRRAKVTGDKLQQVAGLGMEWAVQIGSPVRAGR